MNVQKEFYYKIGLTDKYKITSWNKHLIKMETFLSFLTIDTNRSKDFLGSNNGWTQLENDKYKLQIMGGVYNEVEYLHAIKFGEKLDNVYNNFVNPFYLQDVMTKEGILFFIDYYNVEIKEILEENENEIIKLSEKLNKVKNVGISINNEIKRLTH